MVDDPVLSSLQVEVVRAHRAPLGVQWKATRYSDEFSRLYYIEGGEARVFHHGEEYRMRPDSLFLSPAHTPMDYECPEHCIQHWIHFHARLFGALELFDRLQGEYVVPVRDRVELLRLLERLETLFGAPGLGARLESAGILLQLLAPFLAAVDPERERRRHQGLLRFRRVLEHIDAHLAEPLPVGRLAGLAGLERTHFTRQFAQRLGLSPARYVQRKRIERAKRTLWETDLTIDTIATDLGFADGFHFSRVFKRLTGVSPKTFRLQPRNLP